MRSFNSFNSIVHEMVLSILLDFALPLLALPREQAPKSSKIVLLLELIQKIPFLVVAKFLQLKQIKELLKRNASSTVPVALIFLLCVF